MWKCIVFNVVLFMALVPGILVTLPPHGSKLTVALVHAVVFALAHHFLRPLVMREFFENPDSRPNPPCPPNAVAVSSGDCRIKSDIYGLQ